MVQAYTLGALSVLLVDKNSRLQLNKIEPGLDTLMTMCQVLSGYNDIWGAERRIVACKILAGVFQRDHQVRMNAVEYGKISFFLDLLKSEVSYLLAIGIALVKKVV